MNIYDDLILCGDSDIKTASGTKQELSFRNMMSLSSGIDILGNTEYYTTEDSITYIYLNKFTTCGRYYMKFNASTHPTICFKNEQSSTVSLYTMDSNADYHGAELIVSDCGGMASVFTQSLTFFDIRNTGISIFSYKKPIQYQRQISSTHKTYNTNWDQITNCTIVEHTTGSAPENYVKIPYKAYSKLVDSKPILQVYNLKADNEIEAQTFNALSDQRQKTNLQPLSHYDILNLPLYSFDYIHGAKDQIGCMAQDLQKICPQLVHTNSDGYLTIQENKLIYLLLQEVQILSKKVEELQAHHE